MVIETSAALVVAHPGHELRLFGWLEHARPLLFVISDGSARSASRLPSSRALITAAGGAPGSVFGAFSDAELYQAIIERDAERVADATMALSDALVSTAVQQVVCDAWEDYNPAHDLCRVMTALAVERARAITGRPISFYDYAVVGQPAASGADGEIVLTLDDASLERKLAAARAYVALQQDVDQQLLAGPERFRIECLRPAPIAIHRLPDAGKPAYESYGETRVAEGRYRTVLRYREHFAPFVDALTAAITPGAVPRA